jgi:hypothetical protein
VPRLLRVAVARRPDPTGQARSWGRSARQQAPARRSTTPHADGIASCGEATGGMELLGLWATFSSWCRRGCRSDRLSGARRVGGHPPLVPAGPHRGPERKAASPTTKVSTGRRTPDTTPECGTLPRRLGSRRRHRVDPRGCWAARTVHTGPVELVHRHVPAWRQGATDCEGARTRGSRGCHPRCGARSAPPWPMSRFQLGACDEVVPPGRPTPRLRFPGRRGRQRGQRAVEGRLVSARGTRADAGKCRSVPCGDVRPPGGGDGKGSRRSVWGEGGGGNSPGKRVPQRSCRVHS